MSILFVLLTFLLVITVTHLLHTNQQPAVQPKNYAKPEAPAMFTDQGFEIPKGYCFHPGHTWVLDEGRQNARVGLDTFGANLLGKVDRIEVIGLNRWVRQGQKFCTLTREGSSVDLVAPIEGVVVSINQDVLKDPALLSRDPYNNGWICVIKAPEIATNTKNLLSGSFVAPWMQNSVRRLATLTAQAGLAAAADGGVPMSGVLPQLEPGIQHSIIREFFLT